MRKTVCIISVFLLLKASFVYASLNDGLVGHLAFEEDAGTVAQGLGATAALVNGVSWSSGKIGSALHFDGTNDYVSVTTSTIGTLTDFTLAAWVKLDSTASSEENGNNPLLYIDSANQIVLRPAGFYLKVAAPVGSVIQGANLANASNIGQWVFIAVVKNGSTISYYRNNSTGSMSLQQSANWASGSVNFSSFTLGKMSYHQFNGDIDDLRIYNRSLLQEELNQLYALGAGDIIPPSTPKNFLATPISASEINLIWDPASDNVGVKGYKIYRAPLSGSFVEIADVADTAYKDTGLVSDQTYQYQIKSYDSNNLFSAASVTISATPTDPPVRKDGVVYARSGSWLHVQTAVHFAQSGDKIMIPEGTWEWNKSVRVDAQNRSLTIQGMGVGKTILLDSIDKTLSPEWGDGPSESMMYITTGADHALRVTDLEIQPGSRSATYYGGAAIYINGSSQKVRVDHIKTGPLSIRAVQIRGSALGVIDHNRFEHKTQAILFIPSELLGKSWGDASFENPVDWGGPGAFYVEDNVFISGGGTGAIDGWGGARVVFRYNSVDSKITLHGTESSQRFRGGRSIEVYNNVFAQPISNDTVIDLRSSSAVIFNNTITTPRSNTAIKLNAYRLTTGFAPWGIADGTKAWDKADLTDTADTPGGAGDGVFDSGIATSAGENSLADTSKSWNINQWTGYSLRQTKIFTASSGGVRTVTVAGANWTNNQWAGYELTKVLDNTKSVVLSNTIDTINLRLDYFGVDMTGGGDFILSKAAFILSNTATSITTSSAFQGAKYLFIPGLNYEIRKLDQVLDQTGLGMTQAIAGSPPGHQNLNQSVDPVYEWNNTISGATKKFGGAGTVKLNREYFINTPKPGYTPYVYPHPLVSGEEVLPKASGDVSGNGKVTMYDAALVLRYTLGSVLSDSQKQKADINADGKIDGADVLGVARKAMGL